MSDTHETLILASKSAARRAMLENAGVPFEVRVAGVDEDAVKAASRDLDAAAGWPGSTSRRSSKVSQPGRITMRPGHPAPQAHIDGVSRQPLTPYSI